MLQETHSSIKDSKNWKNDWKGDIFQNHGTSNSRGVLIAFTENFDNKIIKYDHDNNGRIQLLAFEHKKKLYLLVNVYNSNVETEQVNIFKKMDLLLSNFENLENYSIIMGGDWNFIINKELDAYGGNPKLKLNSIAEYTKIKNKFLLCDIFRIRNPDLKRFSFRQQTPTLARRLDHFLISNTVQGKIKTCEIISSLLSDHSPIDISIKTYCVLFKRGPNYWKFNSSLVMDLVYNNAVKEKIREKKTEYSELDNQIKWELIKFDIRSLTMRYSKKNLKKENKF